MLQSLLFRYLLFVTSELWCCAAGGRWKEGLRSTVETSRLSYGAGLVMQLGGIARLELNYVVPVRSQPADRSAAATDQKSISSSSSRFV